MLLQELSRGGWLSGRSACFIDSRNLGASECGCQHPGKQNLGIVCVPAV